MIKPCGWDGDDVRPDEEKMVLRAYEYEWTMDFWMRRYQLNLEIGNNTEEFTADRTNSTGGLGGQMEQI